MQGELIDSFNKGIRADISLQGLDEAFLVVGRSDFCSVSMRALIHSLARAHMCVVILDVCCGKLLAGYLG